MVSHQTSTPSKEPRLPKVSILGVLFFLMGAPHIYAYLTRPLKCGKNVTMPNLTTMALTAGTLAGLMEWLMLKKMI
jgi:hypothetical protein